MDRFLDFAITKVQGILTKDVTVGTLASELAELYVRYYPTTKNVNIWTDLTKTDKDILIDKFQRAINQYLSLN